MYNEMSKKEKIAFLEQRYLEEKLSFSEIARLSQTYANKIRRDAKKFGIKARSRSEAAIVALEAGRLLHPTKGKERDHLTKMKISESQGVVWDNMSDSEKIKRSEIGKRSWDSKSSSEKRELVSMGSAAIREAARTGSKMERFLLEGLIEEKFTVQFHKEHFLKNQKLEVDLFVPDLRTAIEVDGPSHFEPVWGEENLARNQRSDREKTGLILSQGMILIRIKQNKRASQRYFRQTLLELIETLNNIRTNFPPEGERYIEL
jgi:very-short-patch-repair endonuclease